MSIFSFIILIKLREVLYTLCLLYSAMYKSALRKKELIAFFGEYFNEKTICIDFQSHDPKSELFHNLYMLGSAVLECALRKKQL